MAQRDSDVFISESSLPDMINELNSVLVPDEELARIREFSSLLQETRKRREEERKSVLNVIEQLEKTVSELRESSTRASADWRSLEEHTSIMKDMEDQKFDLAKKINEQESMLSSLESEIDELRRESDVLESWDIEEEVGMDRNALSLQLFRGMGFVPYQESTEPDAAITSLIVRSLRRNVATSFDINQDELMKSTKLRYELAKKLWTAAD